MKYIKNCSLWVKKDKNGQPYFSFSADRDIKKGENFNIFKNDKGDNPRRPDYKSYERVEDKEPLRVPSNAEVPDEVINEDVADQIPF